MQRLLKWSEKHLKTDTTYLVKGGFWLMLGQFGLATISLALSVALANLITPNALGQYKFVIAGASIIGAFALTGMIAAVTRSVALGFQGSLWMGALNTLKWSFGIVFLALGTSLYYFLNDNVSLSIAFIVIAILSPIVASTSLFASYLNGTKQFGYLTLFQVIRQLAIALAVVFSIIWTQDPLWMVLAYFLTDATVCFLFFLITQRYFVHNNKIDTSTLTYSKHLSLMEVIKIISSQIDKVLVFTLLGAGPLAVYSVAMAPIVQLKSIDQILASLALPKFSQRSFEQLKSTLYRKVALLTLIMAMVAIAYILGAPYIFDILFPQYQEAVIYSQVYTISLLLIPNILFVKALTAHKKTRQQYILKTFSPLFKILLICILLPFFQVWGLIAALLIAQVATYALILYLFYKS